MERTPTVEVRMARPADSAGMARVHVVSWQETYLGMMSDEILDDPDFLTRRERFWSAALNDSRYAWNRAAVAESNGEVIGIAMSGPSEVEDETVDSQLYLIYLMKSAHGSGAGQRLLDAVVKPEEAVGLWVAAHNPRAQAFYRRNGFVANGLEKEGDGVREIRMIRPALSD
jgi:ribosomal protein S18 acetylase RimI-like enzyme